MRGRQEVCPASRLVVWLELMHAQIWRTIRAEIVDRTNKRTSHFGWLEHNRHLLNSNEHIADE